MFRSVHHFLVQVKGAFAHALNGKPLLCDEACLRSQRQAERFVLNEQGNGLSERFWVPLFEQNASTLFECFWNATHAAGDHGDACGHGLEDRIRESFPAGEQDK